jgi:Zn finger protein HypA/HybF involved in hydrogenase expression
MTATLPKPPNRFEIGGESTLPRVKTWRCQEPTCRHDWTAERPQAECPKCEGDDVCLAPMSAQVNA